MVRHYSYSVEICNTQGKTFAFLADYHNMKLLQPFIHTVRQVDPKGAIRRYEMI
jgi:hypothetical protein